ncbi:zinc ribbon domain-containing protein [Kitasatospora sp. NA04385]|uniref:zinc ribbon domain-containing protein n=1 Tax=Kitasatospora sp. NA04385 TaxID=2742135 RepID=UPI001591E779|nr:zinc ribbon domain-containing protein [Kitasatospora sp. NA04385]QKW19933.1 zinc ribbon domain-containing protein [Kitasatospora sp. NA04385]
MPICPSCGAASADPAATCANCGRPLAAPAIGDVVEDTGPAGAGHSPWGSGQVHHTRETPLVSRGWLIAGRVLVAPTALLVLAAVIGAASQDSRDDESALFETSWSAAGFQTWLSLVLTAFGAPMRVAMSAAGKEDADSLAIGYSTSTHVVMYLVTLGWLLLLWLGLHLSARTRRRAGAAEPAGPAVGLQALRTGALSAAVALLLGWLAGHDSSDTGEGLPSMHVEIGPALLPLTLVAGLAAAVLVLAVDGSAVLRAEAARRGWLNSLLLAWQHASRVVVALLALLTAVALVVELAYGDSFSQLGTLALVTNFGVLIHGVGSGATLLAGGVFERGHESMSLFDLGGHGSGWWFAALPALAAALALGWSAHRGRLVHRDRAVLAGVYALLNTVLLLGTSMWITMSAPGGGDGPLGGSVSRTQDALGWSVPSVLVSSVLWAAFGALVVPGALDSLRGTPVPPAPPRPPAPPMPAVPPVPGELPGGSAVLPGQAVTDRLDTVGSVELVVDEPPAPAVALDKDADPHAGFRRPEAG